MHFCNGAFTELMKIKENKRCFDCNVKSCQWASINNGIFLCTNCSGIHRGLGVDKSYIRSILWDNWTDNQLEFMKKGGNRNLKDFLNDYPYDTKQIKPEIFYNTKIMIYYRKLLKNKVENKDMDLLPPSKEEAFNLNEKININEGNHFSSCGSEQPKVSEINNKDDSLIQNSYNTVIDFVGKTYEKAVNKLDLGNRLNNAKNSFIDTKNKILENKKIKNFFSMIWGGNKENGIDNHDVNDNNINGSVNAPDININKDNLDKNKTEDND